MNLEPLSLCGWLVQTSEPEPEKGSNKRLGMALPRSIRVLQVARSLCCRHPPPMAAMGQRSTAVEPGPSPKIGPCRRRTSCVPSAKRTK